MSAGDQHRVYAVTEGGQRLALTDPLEWGEAQARWQALDDIRFHCGGTTTLDPQGLLKVRYYAVRSCADPEWPQWTYKLTSLRGVS